MFKLALSALISLLFAMTPAEAAKVEQRGSTATVKKQGVKKRAVKKPRYKRREAIAAKRVTITNRDKGVRRVITVRGKRKVVYQRMATAAPVFRSLTAGDRAGLEAGRRGGEHHDVTHPLVRLHDLAGLRPDRAGDLLHEETLAHLLHLVREMTAQRADPEVAGTRRVAAQLSSRNLGTVFASATCR